jgi:bifunctional ADP-heptose synthase (sugar kinase/adenylyltransferase)
VERRILERIREAVPSFDVVLVSDQAETSAGGVVTPAVRDLVAGLARAHPSKVFWVDSRMRAELFRDVIVKPNEREAREACRRLPGRVDFAALQETIGAKPLIVTHGGDGAEIVERGKSVWVAGRKIGNPVDICGAGDSFSAGAAMTMAVTGSASEAARIGNLVASITIMKKGTGTASPAEVLSADP